MVSSWNKISHSICLRFCCSVRPNRKRKQTTVKNSLSCQNRHKVWIWPAWAWYGFVRALRDLAGRPRVPGRAHRSLLGVDQQEDSQHWWESGCVKSVSTFWLWFWFSEEQKSGLARCQSQLDEARQFLTEMEQQARVAPLQYRSEMMSKVRSHRESIAKIQKEVRHRETQITKARLYQGSSSSQLEEDRRTEDDIMRSQVRNRNFFSKILANLAFFRFWGDQPPWRGQPRVSNGHNKSLTRPKRSARPSWTTSVFSVKLLSAPDRGCTIPTSSCPGVAEC